MKFECGPDYVGLAKLCVFESLREVVLSLPDGADMATDGVDEGRQGVRGLVDWLRGFFCGDVAVAV